MTLSDRLKDSIRHSRACREAMGWLSLARSILARAAALKFKHAIRALEFSESRLLERKASQCFSMSAGDAAMWREIVSHLPRYRKLVVDQPALTRSIVLKKPGLQGEKGVLLMYFEYNWARLLLGLQPDDLAWLDQNYDLILSSSWSPTDYAVLAFACVSIQSPLFVQACNRSEIERIERFHPRLKGLDSLPCDWINPNAYQPKPTGERTTDLLMVANWGEFKRHWDFFQALKGMDPGLKVVLIGQKEGGRTKDFILNLARQMGVKQEIVAWESLGISEVARHQEDARVSIIMSRREGCCVAAVESLFAGCALALREDAHVGPLDYINAATGARLRPGHLAEDLSALLERCEHLKPREWALSHLSCHQTAQSINATLRKHAIQAGRPWTEEMVTPTWKPYPMYLTEADYQSLLPAWQELQMRFPSVFNDGGMPRFI